MRARAGSVLMCCWLLLVAGCRPGAPGNPGNGDVTECPRPESLWADIDLDAFDRMPELESLDFSEVEPAAPTTYWELRFAGLGDTRVIGAAGDKCAEAPNRAACETAFAALSADTGFATGCLPLFCYHYVAVNRGAQNTTITTARGFIDFMGTIDNATEATLAAFASGYDWSPSDPSTASIREVEGGYELLVRDLVSTCVPVRSDRFLLFVSKDGDVEVRRRQVYSSLCNACI